MSTLSTTCGVPSASGSPITISSPIVVPQSMSRTIRSCDTSTRRRVRYPESAVRSAVSARSLTGTVGGDEVLQHGQTFAEVRLDGSQDRLALGVGDQTAHTGDLTDLAVVTAGSGQHHLRDGVVIGQDSPIARSTSSVARVQISMISSSRRSWSVIPPMATLASTLAALASAASMIAFFFGGVTTSSMEMVTGTVAQWKPSSLEPVERLGDVDLHVPLWTQSGSQIPVPSSRSAGSRTGSHSAAPR